MNNKAMAQKVVDRITALIDEGKPLPWVKPWNRAPLTVTIVDGYKTVTLPPAAHNRKGEQYKGANTYLPEGEYITFKQCQAEGGHINKGAKGWPVVYWNFIKKDPDPAAPTPTPETYAMLKYYTVFNIKDTDLAQKHFPGPTTYTFPVTHEEPVPQDPTATGLTADPTAEAVITDYIARAKTLTLSRDKHSDRAFYSPSADSVTVPTLDQFQTISEYYSTLFHELGHSTGHASRLNRLSKPAAFGSESYSREELVAETTAATLLTALGLEDGNSFRNSSAYIKSWASHIKADPLMYITAATKAQAAIDLILGLA